MAKKEKIPNEVVTCSYCNGRIIWAPDQHGTLHPLNHTRIRVYHVTPAGECRYLEDDDGSPFLARSSHFLNCTGRDALKAEQERRKAERDA